MIRVIQTHNLEAEFPSASLEQRIKELNSLKYAAPAFAAETSQNLQQQSGIKRPRTSAPIGPAAVSSAGSTIHQYHQPHFQSTSLLSEYPNPYQSNGLLQEHQNPYMSSPAMPYGMMSSTQTISSYTGSLTGSHGPDGVPIGLSGNLDHGGSHPNSSEQHAGSGYYNSVSGYGGYGLQQYYQSSYPH